MLEQVRAAMAAAPGGGRTGGPRIGQTAGLEQGLLSVAVGIAAHRSIEERRVVSMSSVVTDEEMAAACDAYA